MPDRPAVASHTGRERRRPQMGSRAVPAPGSWAQTACACRCRARRARTCGHHTSSDRLKLAPGAGLQQLQVAQRCGVDRLGERQRGGGILNDLLVRAAHQRARTSGLAMVAPHSSSACIVVSWAIKNDVPNVVRVGHKGCEGRGDAGRQCSRFGGFLGALSGVQGRRLGANALAPEIHGLLRGHLLQLRRRLRARCRRGYLPRNRRPGWRLQ